MNTRGRQTSTCWVSLTPCWTLLDDRWGKVLINGWLQSSDDQMCYRDNSQSLLRCCWQSEVTRSQFITVAMVTLTLPFPWGQQPDVLCHHGDDETGFWVSENQLDKNKSRWFSQSESEVRSHDLQNKGFDKNNRHTYSTTQWAFMRVWPVTKTLYLKHPITVSMVTEPLIWHCLISVSFSENPVKMDEPDIQHRGYAPCDDVLIITWSQPSGIRQKPLSHDTIKSFILQWEMFGVQH